MIVREIFLKGRLHFSEIYVLIFFLYTSAAHAQDQQPHSWVDAGVNFQMYPAGFMISGQAMKSISQHGNLLFRLGVNTARRQDFGEHDNEEGGGFGFCFGYRAYLKPKPGGLFLQAQTELWNMNINWRNNPGQSNETAGKTRILVLQPALGAGYQFVTNNRSWAFDFGLAFGVEWNVVSKGEEVGQGGISIGFVTLNRRF